MVFPSYSNLQARFSFPMKQIIKEFQGMIGLTKRKHVMVALTCFAIVYLIAAHI